ncbi:MAG: sugar transferase [Ignavibacteria bacterium]|nr:sugar transferase [Ignavibacteria bacterium]
MKAFILAAGIGKRLQPLSNLLPKGMVPLLNKPLLAYILEHLKNYKIDEIKINLNHLPELIDAYFNDGKDFGLKISYSLEKELCGTAGALKRVSSFFDSTTLVHSGDCLVDVDFFKVIEFHKSLKSDFTILTAETTHQNYEFELEVSSDSKVISISESNNKIKLSPIGVYLIEPQILDLIPQGKFFDIDRDLIPSILKNNFSCYSYKVDTTIYQIKTLNDFLKANIELLKDITFYENKILHTGYSSKIHSSVVKSISHPLLIGENSEIKKNVEFLGPAVIGNDVTIDEGAVISNSVILDSTYVGKNIELKDSIVYKNLHINLKRDFGIYINDEFILKENIKLKPTVALRKKILRVLDIILSLIALIILSPILLIITLLIKLDSKGPAIFISKRVKSPEISQQSEKWYKYEPEKVVHYYKFRTMKISDTETTEQLKERNIYEFGPFFKVKDDPRITRVGKFLRKTSLDELPLLYNVLKGDLRLVGVWGLPLSEAESLKQEVKLGEVDLTETARIRFKGSLGLAGYWQARGRSQLSAEERLVHDSVQAISEVDNELLAKRLGEYKKNHTVKGYISLILDTVKSVINKKGAM